METTAACRWLSKRLKRVVVPVSLVQAIRNGRFAPPKKNEGGRYVWTEADLERALAGLAVDRRLKQYRGGS
jgi:hypothetical protein